MRKMPTPPRPGGVAWAIMVSEVLIAFYLFSYPAYINLQMRWLRSNYTGYLDVQKAVK
jgi:hypothetical protein